MYQEDTSEVTCSLCHSEVDCMKDSNDDKGIFKYPNDLER